MDLYSRVKIGTHVVVLPGRPPATQAAVPLASPADAPVSPSGGSVRTAPLGPPPSAMARWEISSVPLLHRWHCRSAYYYSTCSARFWTAARFLPRALKPQERSPGDARQASHRNSEKRNCALLSAESCQRCSRRHKWNVLLGGGRCGETLMATGGMNRNRVRATFRNRLRREECAGG